jgi:lycopene beta-cyclase
MDFSVEQKGNTRFMYVLPTSKTEALLEYTLFSKELLSKEEYETEIQKYIENLGITEYEIIEKEQGNIPMTCYPFWKHNTKNIIQYWFGWRLDKS